MKITIESTDRIMHGVRLWSGVTEGGVKCMVLVAAIVSESDADHAAIQPELATLSPAGEHKQVKIVEEA